MLLGDGKCWRHSVWESFSIVLRPSGCFPDNHNCGGLHNPLAIYNGVWTEFAECNSDSRISGLVESDVDGIDRFCRSNLRTLVVIPRPLLLKIPVNLFNHFVPRIIFPENFSDIFQKKKSILSTNMNPPSTTAKTTLIYLSALTGVNLVLITSSDPTTVVVGYACLILSISSLASFILDQAMLEWLPI